jgi:spore maturation protein CgeB
MKILVFGLTISSSWGNGHATLWRGLARALAARGHSTVFFERDVPYYAGARDLTQLDGGRLVLYREWEEARAIAEQEIADAEVGIVTSYCPDGVAATDLVLDSALPARVFYDLDTPVTLAALLAGAPPPWIGPRGLGEFDLVLSFTGGRALRELRERLGASCVSPLYGHVDPDIHRAAPPQPHYRADLSYLGTYSEDRQPTLDALFVEAARRRPLSRFVIGGAQYPVDFPWSDNIFFVRHLPPGEHPAFFSSSRLTLNVTRPAMSAMGHCPSGRLFEAAACGASLVSDAWDGLDEFFEPGREILVARDAADVLAALDRDEGELLRIAGAARERVLTQHTAGRRAEELLGLVRGARRTAAGVTVAPEVR